MAARRGKGSGVPVSVGDAGENRNGGGESEGGDGTYPHDLISRMQRTRRCLHTVNNPTLVKNPR